MVWKPVSRYQTEVRPCPGRGYAVLETGPDRAEEPLEIALADRSRVVVPNPGRLRGVVRVRVVAEGVPDRAYPPALTIGVAHGTDEAGRVVVGGGRADHVDVSAERVQAAPARREEGFVGGCAGRGRPEVGRVGLVPDGHVAERDADRNVVHEIAELSPRSWSFGNEPSAACEIVA